MALDLGPTTNGTKEGDIANEIEETIKRGGRTIGGKEREKGFVRAQGGVGGYTAVGE